MQNLLRLHGEGERTRGNEATDAQAIPLRHCEASALVRPRVVHLEDEEDDDDGEEEEAKRKRRTRRD